MATYTTSTRLEKQVTNTNRNTWGDSLNTTVDMIDAALDGVTSLAMTGDVTLTTSNGSSDQSRKRIINITSTGAANRTITIPAVEKWYLVRNAGANQVTIKTASGTGIIVPAASNAVIACDALDCYRISNSGWATIASANLTGGATTEVITVTGFGCTDFNVVLTGVSLSAAGNLGISFSDDNSNWTDTTSIWAVSGGAATVYGGVHVPGATQAAGLVIVGVEELAANRDADSDQCQSSGTTGRTPTAAATIAWRIAAGINYIRFTAIGGATFDAGSYKVLAR